MQCVLRLASPELGPRRLAHAACKPPSRITRTEHNLYISTSRRERQWTATADDTKFRGKHHLEGHRLGNEPAAHIAFGGEVTASSCRLSSRNNYLSLSNPTNTRTRYQINKPPAPSPSRLPHLPLRVLLSLALTIHSSSPSLTSLHTASKGPARVTTSRKPSLTTAPRSTAPRQVSRVPLPELVVDHKLTRLPTPDLSPAHSTTSVLAASSTRPKLDATKTALVGPPEPPFDGMEVNPSGLSDTDYWVSGIQLLAAQVWAAQRVGRQSHGERWR